MSTSSSNTSALTLREQAECVTYTRGEPYSPSIYNRLVNLGEKEVAARYLNKFLYYLDTQTALEINAHIRERALEFVKNEPENTFKKEMTYPEIVGGLVATINQLNRELDKMEVDGNVDEEKRLKYTNEVARLRLHVAELKAVTATYEYLKDQVDV